MTAAIAQPTHPATAGRKLGNSSSGTMRTRVNNHAASPATPDPAQTRRHPRLLYTPTRRSATSPAHAAAPAMRQPTRALSTTPTREKDALSSARPSFTFAITKKARPPSTAPDNRASLRTRSAPPARELPARPSTTRMSQLYEWTIGRMPTRCREEADMADAKPIGLLGRHPVHVSRAPIPYRAQSCLDSRAAILDC